MSMNDNPDSISTALSQLEVHGTLVSENPDTIPIATYVATGESAEPTTGSLPVSTRETTETISSVALDPIACYTMLVPALIATVRYAGSPADPPDTEDGAHASIVNVTSVHTGTTSDTPGRSTVNEEPAVFYNRTTYNTGMSAEPPEPTPELRDMSVVADEVHPLTRRQIDSGSMGSIVSSLVDSPVVPSNLQGSGDSCRCYACGVCLVKWEPYDDPWIEHTRHFPACPLVVQTKGPEYIALVKRAFREAESDEEDPAVYPLQDSTSTTDITSQIGGMKLSDMPVNSQAHQCRMETGTSKHREPEDAVPVSDHILIHVQNLLLHLRSDFADRTMSLRLCQIMNNIGVKQKIRERYITWRLREEMLITMVHVVDALNVDLRPAMDELDNVSANVRGCDKRYYFFGSSIEGTTCIGLNPDDDCMLCNSIPVYERVSDATDAGDDKCYLMIRDQYTTPGYVKLQLLISGKIIKRVPDEDHSIDRNGNVVRNSTVTVDDNSERHGPAKTTEFGNISTDRVEAFMCTSWPSHAVEYLNRDCKWPSTEEKERLRNMGVFVVPVSHPNTEEKDVGWRLSFSLQERQLMFSQNETQYTSYVILKMIKKDLIEPVVGESITSYHLKTCLFYMIEQTDAEIWRPDNLVSCILLCLNKMLEWVTRGICPNYFIPDENMFDRDVHGDKRQRLQHHLQQLLSRGSQIIYLIRCDDVGEQLQYTTNNGMPDSTCITKNNTRHFLRILYSSIQYISWCTAAKRILLGNVAREHDLHTCIRAHYVVLDHLLTTCPVPGTTEEETRDVLDDMLPHIYTSIASNLAARAVDYNDIHGTRDWYLTACAMHLYRGLASDLLSSKLKYATIMHTMGYYDNCELLLNDLERDIKPYSVTQCGCRGKLAGLLSLVNLNFLKRIVKETLTARQILQTSVCCCVSFLHTETAITPHGLQYEMFRSVGTPHASRFADWSDSWYDWAVVDSKIYLYYLQYLNYYMLEYTVTHSPVCRERDIRYMRYTMYKHVAVRKMAEMIKTDPNLKHKETAYNLLGCVYRQEGLVTAAAWSFYMSWRELRDMDTRGNGVQQYQAHHNAAKWHMLCLVYELWLGRQKHSRIRWNYKAISHV